MPSDDSQRVCFTSKSAATAICFDLCLRSMRAAELQVQRIWDRPIVSGETKLVASAFEDILIDVHFYFVALRNIYRYLQKVVSDPAFSQCHDELDQLNVKWFQHYAKGREAFEHIDQRLPGQKHEANIAEINEGGAKRKINYGLRMREGIFLHSDARWDITRATFKQIKHDVQTLLKRIMASRESSNPGVQPTPANGRG